MTSIALNGSKTQTKATTLAELVAELGLTSKRFAIEVNGVLAPKSRLQTHAIADGMVVEIVVAVGGG